jgi:hypothetical protein
MAHLGDGVCARSFETDGTAMSAPPAGAFPEHSRSAAIHASFQDLASPFRQGNFDAYFALVGNRPTWVVEVNDLNWPWDAGGVDHQQRMYLHHVVEFIDDKSLTWYETFGCP